MLEPIDFAALYQQQIQQAQAQQAAENDVIVN
jgi:preprotein translocase subunit SecB